MTPENDPVTDETVRWMFEGCDCGQKIMPCPVCGDPVCPACEDWQRHHTFRQRCARRWASFRSWASALAAATGRVG